MTAKLLFRTNPYGETTPIDEVFRSIPFEANRAVLPGYTPSLSKRSSEAFPVKSVVVNLNCLSKSTAAIQSERRHDGWCYDSCRLV